MTQVIVIGHGHYGTGIKESMTMLMGEPQGFSFIDFLKEESVEMLKTKIKEEVLKYQDKQIILAVDLLGGSPFNESAMLAVENENIVVIAGLNLSAYCEIVYRLNLPAKEVARIAYDSMKISVVVYPESIISDD